MYKLLRLVALALVAVAIPALAIAGEWNDRYISISANTKITIKYYDVNVFFPGNGWSGGCNRPGKLGKHERLDELGVVCEWIQDSKDKDQYGRSVSGEWGLYQSEEKIAPLEIIRRIRQDIVRARFSELGYVVTTAMEDETPVVVNAKDGTEVYLFPTWYERIRDNEKSWWGNVLMISSYERKIADKDVHLVLIGWFPAPKPSGFDPSQFMLAFAGGE